MRAREDRLDHVEQRRLGPVEVLDGDDGRRAGGERTEEPRPRQADLLGDRFRRRGAQRAVEDVSPALAASARRDPLASAADRLRSSSSTSAVSLSAAARPLSSSRTPAASPGSRAAPSRRCPRRRPGSAPGGPRRRSRRATRAESSSSSRLLPIPGSPTIVTRCGRRSDSVASCNSRSSASSRSRPTKRVARGSGGASRWRARPRGPGDRLEAQRVGGRRARGVVDGGAAGRRGAVQRRRGAGHAPGGARPARGRRARRWPRRWPRRRGSRSQLADPQAARTARSASSSWATGAPNTATSEPARDACAVAPKPSTDSHARRCASASRGRSSSGSSAARAGPARRTARSRAGAPRATARAAARAARLAAAARVGSAGGGGAPARRLPGRCPARRAAARAGRRRRAAPRRRCRARRAPP